MTQIKLIYQPLILTVAGDMPTIPSPASITPDDPTWDPDHNLLVGQMAYNIADDIWYYRTVSLGIKVLNNGGEGGSSSLFDLTDTAISLPIEDGSILRFDSDATDWVNVDTIEADTLNTKTADEIRDEAIAAVNQVSVISSITDAPSTVGWYAIGRWKSLNCNFEASLITHPGGGLTHEVLSVVGIVDSSNISNWAITITSSSSNSFENVRVSQYNVGGEDYTYLEVQKSVTNVGTFSVVAKKELINSLLNPTTYTFEALSFTDISGLSAIRRSQEYDSNTLRYNNNNSLKITADSVSSDNGLKIGESSPIIKFIEDTIGSWDMSTTDEFITPLPVGVTFDKVMDCKVMLNDDANTERLPLTMDGYWFTDNLNQLHLVRNDGGLYSTSNFSVAAERGDIYLTVKA